MFDNVLKDMDNLPKHICFSIGVLSYRGLYYYRGFGIASLSPLGSPP
jgi:hypothetical protein